MTICRVERHQHGGVFVIATGDMFQINTMAMQRASPTMINPVRYSGYSDRNNQASANISAGPITQFSTSDVISSFGVPARQDLLVVHPRQHRTSSTKTDGNGQERRYRVSSHPERVLSRERLCPG
jgi:hypothetical protein